MRPNPSTAGFPSGLALALTLSACSPLSGAPAHSAELLKLAEEIRAVGTPRRLAGVPDYSAEAVREMKAAVGAARARLEALRPSGGSVHDRVDWLLVRSELDLLEYTLHVQRPQSKNPNFYLSSISSAGMLSGATLSRLGRLVMQPPPFGDQRAREILNHMRAIPRILEAARRNLTEPDAQRTRWALATLEGTREGSRRFAAALARHFPPALAMELGPAGEAMGEAFHGFEQWLRETMGSMGQPKPAGRKLYDWLLRRVWLLPYDSGQILRMGEHSVDQAVQYQVDRVPTMEPHVSRAEVELYVRWPYTASSYLIGKKQIEQILGDRIRELGFRVDWREFHDAVLSHGCIPLALVRWEMTGNDDQLRKLWD
jgi:hypothetical protein